MPAWTLHMKLGRGAAVAMTVNDVVSLCDVCM